MGKLVGETLASLLSFTKFAKVSSIQYTYIQKPDFVPLSNKDSNMNVFEHL